MVGAAGDDNENGTDAGAGYVYRWNGSSWEFDQKLLAPDGSAGDEFGETIAVTDNVIIVNARRDDDACPEDINCNSGSAYIFRYDGATWAFEQKLSAQDAAAGDSFGESVAISGDVAVVGAARDDNDNGLDAGSAYVFHFDGTAWVERRKLLASDGTTGDFLGQAIDVSGNVAVVGAPGEEDNQSVPGSAYVFFVPEPSTTLLLGVALVTLAWIAHRSRSSSAGSMR